MLRHIGVDYGKPSSVYTCGVCGDSFMYPDMSVLCASCRQTHSTDGLMPIDVEEYEFTPEGIRAFANNDVRLTVSQVGFYGYSSMRDFLDYLRMASRTGQGQQEVFVIARFYVFDPMSDEMLSQDVVPPIVRAMTRFYNYKSALWGNNYYFLCRVAEGEIAVRRGQMEYELKEELDDYRELHDGFQFELVDTYIYTPGDDVEQFIRRIEDERH